MGGKISKKIGQIILWIVIGFLILDLVVVGLLFVPAVQTFAVKKITQTVSKQWGTTLSIEKVHLTPSLKIIIKGIHIEDNRHHDMIYVGTTEARIKAISITPLKLKFGAVAIDNADVILRKYAGDSAVNIAIWAQKFQTGQTTNSFLLTATKLHLTHSRFLYIDDKNRTVWETNSSPNIDYAYFELKNLQLEARKFVINGSDISTTFKHLAFKQYGGFTLKDGSGDFRICDTLLSFNKMKLITQAGKIDADLYFKYSDWTSYSHFNDSIRIVATIRPSTVAMNDIAGFAPALKGMNDIMVVKADRFDGCVNRFHLINLTAGWGMNNFVKGDFAIQNILHFKNAHFNVQLDTCNFNLSELAHFTLPAGKTIPINKTLAKFGNTSVRGSFIGTASVFDANVDAYSDLGTFFVNLSTLADDNQLKITGSATSPNFNMAKLTNSPKALGYCDADFSIDGHLNGTELTADNLNTLTAHLFGHINRFDLYHYPISHINIEGDYQDRRYDCTLEADDPHLECDFTGHLTMDEELPTLQSFINLHRFDPGAIATLMPPIDSAEAKGFESLIAFAQRNPSLQIGFNNFSIAFKGNQLDNINGYLGCDNIHIKNKNDSISNERIRLTAINVSKIHKYILSSSIANASLETTYPLNSIADSLQAIAYHFFPNLLPAQTSKRAASLACKSDANGYLKLHVNTYRTRQLFALLMPNLTLSPNSDLDVAIHSDTMPNTLELHIPRGGFKHKLLVHNLSVKGSTVNNNNILHLTVRTDSAIAIVNNNRFSFRNINIGTQTRQNVLFYKLDWHNDFNANPENNSTLSGLIDASNPDDIMINLRNSKLYIKDMAWKFNDDNAIHIRNKAFDFNNLQFSNNKSDIAVNGTYDKYNSSKVTLYLKNVDISMLNPFLSNMTFGGDLSANVSLETQSKRSVLTGKVLASDFAFNNEHLGNLFLVAGRNTPGFIGFSGGIFRRDQLLNSNAISNYSIRDFQREDHIIAEINGNYLSDKRRLAVHTVFDTLKAGFLTPFLAGFSNSIQGTASGKLSFYAMPDTTYFDGKVRVLRATMGISALGTKYLIQNQDIAFNREGIFFDKMQIKDQSSNVATLNGSVKHQSFKDMQINLTLNTNRIMALNTSKAPNSVFYGTGYVAGKVSITGDGHKLYFKGPNIQALEGSKIVLQVSNTNMASQSDIIHFNTQNKPNNTHPNLTGLYLDTLHGTALDFDFTFNIANTTDVVLLIDPIGGTLNGRTDGQMQLTYNDKDGLNLYGNLQLHSGDFKISLYNVVNQKFTLVPGGNILFDGPLENMVVNVGAYKSSKTSLNNIISQEYLPGNGANVNVNAYLKLNGPLMQRINPIFSFELPNSSNEVRNLFYTAIDTSNTENITKQFAYFLLTNNFMPNDMFSSNTTNLGASGYNMLSNIVNSMISNLMAGQNGSFGLTYNQATETSSAEYGVKANANLLKNRMTMETNIGYYDDRTTSGNSAFNNMYGDFTVEYSLNESGTWKVKAYTYLGERDEDYYLHDAQINYTAGVAIVYKQEFDTQRRKKGKKTVKNNINNHNNSNNEK